MNEITKRTLLSILSLILLMSFNLKGEAMAGSNLPGWVKPDSPLGKNQHPRLLITPKSKLIIAKRALGTHADMYEVLRNRAKGLLTERIEFRSGSYATPIFDKTAVLALTALIEKINGNPSGQYQEFRDRAFEYAQFILDNIDPWTLTSLYAQTSFNIRGQCGAISIVYDWLYDDLPGQLKQDCHIFLRDIYKGLHNIERPSSIGQVRKSVYGSNYHLEWGAHPWFALTLYGDGLGDDELLIEAVEATKTEVYDYIIPGMNRLGGAMHNGWGYELEGDQSFVYLNIRAWETASSEQVFTDSFALKEFSRFFLHASKPDGALIKLNDSPDTYCDPQYPYGYLKYGKANARSILVLLMDFYKDGYAKYISDKGDFKPTGNAGWRMWRNLIFYDETVEVKDPSTLPLTRFFEGTGILMGRSAWNDKDSLYYTFRNRDQFGAHSDCKQNSFTIHYKGSPLAINDGNYPNGHSEKLSTKAYLRRTISSNSMLVFDPGETVQQYKKSLPIDGGQKYGDYKEVTGLGGYAKWSPEVYEPAEFDLTDNNSADNEFEEADNYTYIRGDATRGYTKKISHFTREFVRIKPGYFVIYDRVNSTNKNFRKSFLLHSITEPELNGKEDFTIPGTYETTGERACQGDTDAGISKSFDSNLAEIVNGNGKLFAKTLLPSKPVIRKVGGEGYRFWVDYANENIAPYNYTPSVTGGWRLEISPGTAALEDRFLHLLVATDALVDEMVETRLIEAANMQGLLINDPASPQVVLFSSEKEGGAVSEVNYKASYPNLLTGQHLLFNMELGVYDIFKDSVKKDSNVSTSPKGVILFESQGGGIYQVIKTGTPLPDIIAPSIPSNITANGVTSTSLNLSWSACTDKVGVTGYIIYRNGVKAAIVKTNSYSDKGLAADTNYSYQVSACDAAENESGKSESLVLKTKAEVLREKILRINPATGGSTTPGLGLYSYADSEIVNLRATPDKGWTFDHWTGGVDNDREASTFVKMDEDKSITASFKKLNNTIDAPDSDGGSGGGSGCFISSVFGK